LTETTPTKKHRKGQFPPGVSGNPKGTNRYTSTKTIQSFDAMFLDKFFKDVDALQGGTTVRASHGHPDLAAIW